MTNVALVTGGFDPIHQGHIELILDAQNYGDEVWVGLNSDEWLIRKKGFVFMPLKDRLAVVRAIKGVTRCLSWDDSNDSAGGAMFKAIATGAKHINFCNGGDRVDITSLPKAEQYWNDRHDCDFIFGVGGEKKNSSSQITQDFKAPQTDRTWGYYRVLHEVEGCKVKELTVNPGEKLSMQQHEKRSEFWLVTEGSCIVNSPSEDGSRVVHKHSSTFIPPGMWHQLINPFPEPCRIVEIQYGLECIESDIKRWDEGVETP